MVVLGILLVLDASGRVHLGFAYAAPAVIGALGVVLIASGIEARSRSRD
jgi:hypothetical protein